MTSKSGVSVAATCTARITRLAMVPLSLYAGKKTLRPAALLAVIDAEIVLPASLGGVRPISRPASIRAGLDVRVRDRIRP